MGYEHVVVNMYTVPCSMALGSGVSWGLFWGWSIAPSTLGNMVGASLLVAFPMWVTHGHEYRQKQREAKQIDDKLTGSSSSDGLMNAEEAIPPTYPDGSFVDEAPEALYSGNNAAPNTPDVRHY
eukprot:EG_transcript_3933